MSGAGVVFAALGCAVLAAAVVQGGQEGGLKPGDPAPPFTLPGSDGKIHTLADYKGKQPVVLAWFVKAFTSG